MWPKNYQENNIWENINSIIYTFEIIQIFKENLVFEIIYIITEDVSSIGRIKAF